MVALFSVVKSSSIHIALQHTAGAGRIYGLIIPDMMSTEIAGDEPKANQRLFFLLVGMDIHR